MKESLTRGVRYQNLWSVCVFAHGSHSVRTQSAQDLPISTLSLRRVRAGFAPGSHRVRTCSQPVCLLFGLRTHIIHTGFTPCLHKAHADSACAARASSRPPAYMAGPSLPPVRSQFAASSQPVRSQFAQNPHSSRLVRTWFAPSSRRVRTEFAHYPRAFARSAHGMFAILIDKFWYRTLLVCRNLGGT